MLIVAGEIRMQPGTRDQFFEAVGPMVAASRLESGCRTYVFTPDLDDPELIRLYELWDDDEALAEHAASDHMAAWIAVRDTLPIAGASLFKYSIASATPLG